MSSSKKRETNVILKECRICGAPAEYSYYGTISCRPCKMFFKRNAEKGQELLKCDYNGKCDIDINTRHICSLCRLMKCFHTGMKKEMLRASNPKKSKPNPVESPLTASVQFDQPEQVSRFHKYREDLNRIDFQLPTLTTDQWNRISHLLQCYDEHSGLLATERFLREQKALPPKFRFKSKALIDFLQLSIDELQLFYLKNEDFLSLSSDDRSILLHSTAKHAECFSANFIYFQCKLYDDSSFNDAIASISTPTISKLSQNLFVHFDFDFIVMKLILAILCFSTLNSTIFCEIPPQNLSNIQQILNIQNTYVELLWSYLLYKYPYERTVICFSNIIRCVFIVNEIVAHSENLKWFSQQIDSLRQNIEQNLISSS